MVKFTIPDNIKLGALFFSVYGSHNYNLNHSDSDTDVRVFVKNNKLRNTFEFMHNNTNICVNDISLFYTMIKRQVPKFLELLFSDNIYCDTSLKQLLELKDDIVKMDLVTMYASHYYNYIWHRDRYLSYQMGLRKINYAIHAYRSLDILDRFYETDFGDYNYAIKYSDSDRVRELFLYIKNNHKIPKCYNTLLYEKDKKVSSIEKKYNRAVQCNTVKEVTNIFHVNIKV